MSEETNVISNVGFDDDRAVIKAFLSGDEGSFDRLVIKYKDVIFGTCCRLLGNYDDANDCAQETFLRVYRSLGSFRFESAFSTWIYRIALNICKNRVTSSEYKKSTSSVALDALMESDEGGFSKGVSDGSLSLEDSLEERQRGVLIHKAIESLEEEHKTVIVLRDIEGLSYDDVAQITGCNLGTVKSRLARARQQLVKRLKNEL